MSARRCLAAVCSILGFALLAGCVAPVTTTNPSATPTPIVTMITATLPASRSVDDSVAAERAVASVTIVDLSQRLDIPADEVTVVSIEEVRWPDTSLGCPAPDMAYAQMVVDGVKIVLEANGQTYAYHGRDPKTIFLCTPQGPAEPAAPPPQGSPDQPVGQAEAFLQQLKADMAQILGVPESTIEVVSIEYVTWSNSGLGCEAPGEVTLQVITPGYRIVLAAGDNVFEYHTDSAGNYRLCEQSKR